VPAVMPELTTSGLPEPAKASAIAIADTARRSVVAEGAMDDVAGAGGLREGLQLGDVASSRLDAPTTRHINGRASTVYGGSSEVQHSILARLLGL